MNILLINHYAGSDRLGMEYRPFYLAREWVASGHRVTIIGAAYSHLRGVQPDARHDLALCTEEGVRFRWLRSVRYSGNGIGRVLNMMEFVARLLFHAGRIAREERPDVVICSSTYPLDIYPGALIARLSGARLVFEVHDLWPLTPMLLGGYKPRHPYIRLLQHAEESAYAQADLVVSLLPDARPHMVERGMAPGKFVHIPNGVPITEVIETANPKPPARLTALLASERERGRFLIGYAGGITLSTAVDLLVDVAALREAADVSFLIAGDGPAAANLSARVTLSGLDNVHLLGHIPKQEIAGFLAGMDALAISLNDSPLYRYGVSPNKMFDYMLARRPILQAADTSNDLVAEAGCGFTAPPGDARAFAAAVTRLRTLPVAERARLGENGHRFVLANHDFRILAARFLGAVERLPRGE